MRVNWPKRGAVRSSRRYILLNSAPVSAQEVLATDSARAVRLHRMSSVAYATAPSCSAAPRSRSRSSSGMGCEWSGAIWALTWKGWRGWGGGGLKA